MKLDANCQLRFNSHCLYSSAKQREVVMEVDGVVWENTVCREGKC